MRMRMKERDGERERSIDSVPTYASITARTGQAKELGAKNTDQVSRWIVETKYMNCQLLPPRGCITRSRN